MEPVAFGVTQCPGMPESRRRPANRTEGEGGAERRLGWCKINHIKKNPENTTLRGGGSTNRLQSHP